MAGNVVSYAETQAIKAFLGFLNTNYSKRISANDNFLIAAISAWFHQESGGIRNVIGNNPFNIRPGMLSFMSNGYRVSSHGNGKFLTFATLAKGFQAAAYLLIHGNKAYGYRLAVDALKKGGNQGAVDFLAAMAMSSWDAGRYGTNGTWQEAYNPKMNHLLRNYIAITGVQVTNPNPHPKPRKPQPKLPRDFNYNPTVRSYLDPWAASDLYRRRKRSNVDGFSTRR
jgi:hypothetical protein